MAFIPAPEGTVRCVHNMTLQGQECLIVCYVEVSDSPSAADLLDLANEMFTAFQTTLFVSCSDEVTLNFVQCTDVEVENGLQATSNLAAVQGGSAIPAISNALSMVLSLRTPFSGRSNRGRMYIPGMRNDTVDTDSNYWTAGQVTTIQDRADDWLAAVEGITLGAKTVSLVVASYYTLDPSIPTPPRTVPRAAAITTGVTSILARRRIGTQRRRRPRT